MTMPEPWWSCCCLPGRQRKSGSSDSATFMRKVPEPDLRPRETPMQIGLDGAVGHEIAEQQLRGQRWRPRPARRCARPTPGERRRPCRPRRSSDGDRRLGADDGAARLRRTRHGLRDGAHAADGVAPHARLAVDLAEAVVQQHVGRARRVRAGIGADDAVEGERALDHLALEPVRRENRPRSW